MNINLGYKVFYGCVFKRHRIKNIYVFPKMNKNIFNISIPPGPLPSIVLYASFRFPIIE